MRERRRRSAEDLLRAEREKKREQALKAYQPDIILIQEGLKPLEPWEGFTWYGTPDPGVLTRFPAEILSTEKVGPWTEPQLLLVDIRGKGLIVANVRLMLPSVIVRIVHPLSENPSSFAGHASRASWTNRFISLRSEAITTSKVVIATAWSGFPRLPPAPPPQRIGAGNRGLGGRAKFCCERSSNAGRRPLLAPKYFGSGLAANNEVGLALGQADRCNYA